jgi:hypothetical protein
LGVVVKGKIPPRDTSSPFDLLGFLTFLEEKENGRRSSGDNNSKESDWASW